MCTFPQGQDTRVRVMALWTDLMVMPPSAGCTHSMFPPLSAQCPSKGLRFLQMMTCSFTTGLCTSANPTSSPHSSPHKLTTMSPNYSLTLRMEEFSIATVHTRVPLHWRHPSTTLTLMAPFVSGTSTPMAVEIQEPLLADRAERQVATTTSLATFSPLGRSTAL